LELAVVGVSKVTPVFTVHFKQASQQLPEAAGILVYSKGLRSKWQPLAIPSDTKFPWEWDFSGFIASLSIIFLATIYRTVDSISSPAALSDSK